MDIKPKISLIEWILNILIAVAIGFVLQSIACGVFAFICTVIIYLLVKLILAKYSLEYRSWFNIILTCAVLVFADQLFLQSAWGFRVLSTVPEQLNGGCIGSELSEPVNSRLSKKLREEGLQCMKIQEKKEIPFIL